LLPSLIAGAVAWSLRHSLAADLQPVIALILLGITFLVTYVACAALTAENRALMISGMASVRSSKLFRERVDS